MEEISILEPLKEVTTIAAGNAATALSKFIGTDVTVAVPAVDLVTIEEVLSVVGDTAHVAAAAVVKIEGDMQGLLLFALDPGDAQQVANEAIKHQIGGSYVDKDQAVLREMVNIVAGAALNSVGTFLDLRLEQSVPASTTDMVGAILDPFIALYAMQFDKVLVQQELFAIPSHQASLKFLMIVDPPSTNRMLQQIAEKVNPGHAADH